MKCEPCFGPLTLASADGADPPRPGSSRPAENTSTPSSLGATSAARPPAETAGPAALLQPRADPVRPGPSGGDMIYFGRNRAIEICEQKAEPWSWAEQQTVTDPPNPTSGHRTKERLDSPSLSQRPGQ